MTAPARQAPRSLKIAHDIPIGDVRRAAAALGWIQDRLATLRPWSSGWKRLDRVDCAAGLAAGSEMRCSGNRSRLVATEAFARLEPRRMAGAVCDSRTR